MHADGPGPDHDALQRGVLASVQDACLLTRPGSQNGGPATAGPGFVRFGPASRAAPP
jgi:hypothetical protein